MPRRGLYVEHDPPRRMDLVAVRVVQHRLRRVAQFRLVRDAGRRALTPEEDRHPLAEPLHRPGRNLNLTLDRSRCPSLFRPT